MNATSKRNESVGHSRSSRRLASFYLFLEKIGTPLALLYLLLWILFGLSPDLSKKAPELKFLADFFSNQFSFLYDLLLFLFPAAMRIAAGYVQQESVMHAAEMLPTHAENLEKLSKKIQGSANDIQLHELTTTKKALTLIGEFLKLGTSQARVDNTHAKSSRAAMEAVACNLGNWEKQIQTHYTKGPDGKFLTEVWIRSQSAYFLEEGFDVGKKVLATNGRNLCFVILAALDALMEMGDKRMVRYTAVTPVNPKDWYNWPHGYDNRKEYYESDFIGDYYRVLREIVHTNKDKLKHNRYVLCSMSNEPSESITQPFGWKLDSMMDMQKSLCGRMLPFSVPNTQEFIGQTGLQDYLNVLVSKYPVPNKKEGKPAKTFIPIEIAEWEISQTLSTLTDKQIMDFGIASRQYHKSKAEELLTQLDNFLIQNLLIDDSVQHVCANAKEILHIADLNSDVGKKCMDWLRDSHAAEAHLSGCVGLSADTMQQLRSHLLRSLDYLHYQQSQNKIYQVFGSQLHTTIDDCLITPLEASQIRNNFTDKEIEPEFHLFGYENSDGSPDWRLCITAALNYPFDATILTLQDDPGEINKYQEAIAFLESKSKKISDFILLTV
ncbi:MAG: hypothetical protein WCI64_07630 [Chlorobium sp.]|jgi:hypothetical protein